MSSSLNKELFRHNIDQVIELMEMIKNESGQIDVIRVD
jgi:hypothetical protein